MEFFDKAKVVALRSNHEKYLHAHEDKESVRQHSDGLSKGSRWTVELVTRSDSVIRLKSCYGRYLTATNHPFLTGLTGRKVEQSTLLSSSRALDCTVEWEPIKYGNRIRLKSCYSQLFLRANGYWPPWRNWITHCPADGRGILHNSDLEWKVDILETRPEGTTSQIPGYGNVPASGSALPPVVAYYRPPPTQRDDLRMERAELAIEVGNLLVSTASLMLRDSDADYGGASGPDDVLGVLDEIGNANDATGDACDQEY
ncbi:uncharacterized protein LOC107422744 isoform X2 [Ziziphus jujuba]|uniref:Uncharacterized protein LOC107422744 isoform X2 n=2 Tax=Ziziphus jujuba TaxID=326968 RepID=A0A6P4A2L0_ZIZJJ|nr:uncharacterized protein LOC107422744 isoform X2 [Ziziphus jujuba]KAH7521972.1 hypothetical protein FEM48_Zijuj07G0088600 [Ziziphus jujuba var. spinosa]